MNQQEKLEELEGIVFSFSGYPYAYWNPTQYGWLKLNDDKSIKKIGYKTGWNLDYSNPIVTGHFWFPSIERLKINLEIFYSTLKEEYKEQSIDDFCQFLIEKGKKVNSHEVDDFLCLGTPDEFRTYEYWLEANEISNIK